LTPEARKEAEAWNRSHTTNVVQFDRSTSGRYSKYNGELDADGVAAWQADHGLPISGKADDETVAAVLAEKRGGSKPASPPPPTAPAKPGSKPATPKKAEDDDRRRGRTLRT
jgi:hypothetical protein